ncbi:PheS-related mystery ligase SrmL [Hamadaea tsunoensis]|uniref:PheS-related mystery ligase SrmL n=1 Tax=Hamadaea tsunoensis TaxID=53368 RepID=UPI000427AF57|nr:hypothetical protein [Hamadaea tsunoensis]
MDTVPTARIDTARLGTARIGTARLDAAELGATELGAAELDAALRLRDLSDPAAGPHAMQVVLERIEAALAAAWGVPVRRDRGSRVVEVTDNYDALRYAPDAVTRDRRYTRYIGAGRMLRSHTTARIPGLLREVTGDVVLCVPGLCYRRDVIDRHHVGQPHQLDLWRVRRNGRLTGEDLEWMAGLIVGAILPGRRWWTVPSEHPYTVEGREIYVEDGGGAVEIGECGLAHPEVLAAAGLAGASGLAMGLGLDRLVMLAKGVPDIRLLRSADPRVAAQMLDLAPYVPVSMMPPVRRDLSLAVPADLDEELLGDRVRGLLAEEAEAIEEVVLLSETAYAALPDSARTRMGMRDGQKNLLLRLVLRHPDRTLTDADANALRDRVYAGLHEGTRSEWTTR